MTSALFRSKIFLLLIGIGLFSCSPKNSDGNSEIKRTTNCSEQFQQLYIQYRKNNEGNLKAIRESDKKEVVLPRGGERLLFVYPIDFTPDFKVLNCAASEGDQLANYMMAIIRSGAINDDTESSPTSKLQHLRRAAVNKVGAPAECVDIDLVGTAECSSGLPEAHLLMADTSFEQGKDCGGNRLHYRIAVSQGALSAWAVPTACR